MTRGILVVLHFFNCPPMSGNMGTSKQLSNDLKKKLFSTRVQGKDTKTSKILVVTFHREEITEPPLVPMVKKKKI